MSQRTRMFDNGVNTATFAAAAVPPPEGWGRTLAVTFDPLDSLDVERPGFGEPMLTEGGVDVLAVQKRRENWYQDLSRETFVAEFGARIRAYDRVLFYGFSAGGYAALYFARPFAAQVLAISPRLSIHPAYAAHARVQARWGVAFRHAPLAEGADRTRGVALLHDPRLSADRLSADDLRHQRQEILPAYAAAELLPIPYCGHYAVQMLKEMRLLKPLVFGYLAAGRLPALPWRARRADSWSRQMLLGLALLRHRRPALAARFGERAMALRPRRSESYHLAAQIRRAQGDTAGALEALRAAVAALPRSVPARLRLVQALQQENAGAEAAMLLREGLALLPGQPRFSQQLEALLRQRPAAPFSPAAPPPAPAGR
ncbi:tetratricopeptide repeat protein [Teichococcus rhizosphaerae]|nr:tetratricopeptide repeat protein [Pseudoroseomonas rhizosphaerae]